MAANTLDLIRARERKLRGGTPARRSESLPAQAGSAPATTGQTAYDNFYKSAQDAGLLGSFSEQDLQLARKNPAAGMSILSAKQQWQNADTDEAKALANKRAEAIRSSYGGYTGGTDGKYYNLNPLSPISFEAQDPYGERIDRLLTAMENREPFQFSYNPNTDPEYQAFRKAALREGRRATEDTMGAAAMMTGGRPSSYAVSAAGQQGNYYAGQIADKIPELAQQAYQRAYQKYTDEFTQKMQTAGMLQSQQQANYGRLMDEVSNQERLRNEESQARQEQMQKAMTAYQMGDPRLLNELGIDTSNDVNRQMQDLEVQQQKQQMEREQRDEQYRRAWEAYQIGDEYFLNQLGIDTTKDVSRQLQEMQMRTYEWQDQLQRAQAAAQYGDYRLLNEMGFDTSQADFDKQLTIAQIAAAYGDFSMLRDLLNGRGANLMAGTSSGTSGSSRGGNYSYNPQPSATPKTSLSDLSGLNAEKVAAARARNAGATTTDYGSSAKKKDDYYSGLKL